MLKIRFIILSRCLETGGHCYRWIRATCNSQYAGVLHIHV